MGTQKNRLNEMFLLGTKNIRQNLLLRKFLQFFAEILSKPVRLCSKLDAPCKVHLTKQIFTCEESILHDILALGFDLDMTNGSWTLIFNVFLDILFSSSLFKLWDPEKVSVHALELGAALPLFSIEIHKFTLTCG